jgi:L-ascorbate metabolism protein UlaG (beta-lactamase superfamily)
MNRSVYLKPNVLAEPLFNQWYAWPYLIPPVSAAMYIANAHLKMMESFVAAPQVHIAALKNPAMLGGPFINHGAQKTVEIRELLARTTAGQAHMLELANAVKELEEMLSAEADGYSLEPFYERVPEILRGYVELVYDLHNHPSVRFIEGLLYHSKYYNETAQSIVLSETQCDGRPFVFSTPRLKSDGCLYLNLPFKHPGLDELFRMKSVPQPFERIRELLNINAGDEPLFSNLFTDDVPEKVSVYEGDGVRVRYFGHACVLLEARGLSILCDPVVSYKYDGGTSRYTFADLPEVIDYILLTHNHQDHVMFETLLQLRHKTRSIIVPRGSGGDRVDPSLKRILQVIGFDNVYEIDGMEKIAIEGGYIMGLPFLGEHADLDIRTKMAHCVNLKGHSILMAADSNNLESRLYEHIHELTGDIDVLLLGMECDGAPMSWLYGPLLTRPLTRKNDQSRRFNGSDYEKGMGIVERLRPRQVYVYAMGQEPWCTFLTSIQYTDESSPIVNSNRLANECRKRGITAEVLFGHKELHLS